MCVETFFEKLKPGGRGNGSPLPGKAAFCREPTFCFKKKHQVRKKN